MEVLVNILVLLTLTLLISSCGKSNSSAGMPVEKKKVLPVNGSNIERLYMANFFKLNEQVNGNLSGSAILQRRDDKFFAYVRLSAGAPGAWHQQNIHEGGRCPTSADDLNADGYIDIEEGERVWGKILIPLDSNLNSQSAGENIYPVADQSGDYFYERETSFKKMFRDLKSEDTNPLDNIAKIPEALELDFAGKIVVIHSASSTASYPETVATQDGLTAIHTLPVACGIFEQVTSVPGEPQEEGIPERSDEPERELQTPDEVIPVPGSGSRPDTELSNEELWYDRILVWWRSTWERERDGN
jgi:hypothetical protein